MSTKIRLSALCLALATTGIGNAADPAESGKYTTRVVGDRLFLEDGHVLRCDLFFCAPDGDVVVAPKGSRLEQTVPPVVWQYSRLLPAKNYLKTAHVHSISSKLQERPWDDVQRHFYDGLLIEGATDTDAKIAYAGAYAFSPRWSFVDLVEVEETESKYPDSVLFRVEYTQPQPAEMTVEEYRALSLQILQQPENMSLQAIQAAIDESSGGSETKFNELARLGGFRGLNSVGNPIFPSDADLAKAVSSPKSPVASEAEPGVVLAGGSTLKHGGGQGIRSSHRVVVEAIQEPITVETLQTELVSAQDNGGLSTDNQDESEGELIAIVKAELVTEVEGPEDEWVFQPEDGTLVLRDVGKYVFE